MGSMFLTFLALCAVCVFLCCCFLSCYKNFIYLIKQHDVPFWYNLASVQRLLRFTINMTLNHRINFIIVKLQLCS